MNWFVDNKLSMHFDKDEAKSILLASKFKRKNIKNLIQNTEIYKSNNILKPSTYDAYWTK